MDTPSDIFIEPSDDIFIESPPPAPAARPDSRRLESVTPAVSLLLFVVACALPGLVFKREAREETWLGVHCVALGWLGLFEGEFAWLANPLYAASLPCLFYRRWRAALVCCILALLLAADTFTLAGQELPADEGGIGKMFLGSIGAGCYVWLASILVIGVGAATGYASRRS